MTETLTALEGGHVPDPAPGATGAVFLSVLLAAFVIAERRVAYPLLPLRVVLDRKTAHQPAPS